MIIKSKQFGTLIGTFGKGVEGSNTINFAPSGGENCSAECPLKGNACYAEAIETLKGAITVNLAKKAADPDGYMRELCEKASKVTNSPWIRFSALGSIPSNPSEAWIRGLQRLASILPVERCHFPVETFAKAALVRFAGFTARVSAATSEDKMWQALALGHVVSLVVDCGKRCVGKNKRSIAKPAFEKARELRAKGINVKVCPAISGSAKCGNCTMCADPEVQVIIYPRH